MRFLKLFIAGLVLWGSAMPAFAAAPNLSASYQGNNLQITITNADPYSSVNLYTRQSSSLWTVISNLGQTSASGYFSQVLNMASDGSGSPLQVYATVGGQQSQTLSVYPGGFNGCIGNNCMATYGLSLSQNNLNLNIGQSSTVTAYNQSYNQYYGSYNTFYLSSNSNPSVASASISGNQITIYGSSNGSTTMSFCGSGSSGCATLYVTVGSGTSCFYYGNNCLNLTFSPTSLSINTGQTGYVNVLGSTNNAFYVSSNSNPNVASASISGNVLNVYGLANGNTNIYICQTGSSLCGSVQVYVSGSSCGYYGCGGSLSLSQTNVNLSVNQSVNVTAYNVSGLTVASNSNTGIVSTSISGNQLTLYALSSGSATLYICATNSSQCAYIYVTVSGSASGNVWFSQSNPTLSVGQNLSITLNSNVSGSSYYVSSNSNSNVVSASISGSTLNLYANQSGNASIVVCRGSSSTCGTLYVTVIGGGNLSFSQSNVSLNVNQSASVTVNNPSGSVYISNNSNPSVASASIGGSIVYINALQAGSTNITVCQNYGGQCGTIYVNVSGASSSNQVYLYDNYYSPQSITIPVGGSITWRNNGSMSHTVTFDAPYSDSGTIFPGGTYTQTFNTPGTYYYRCRFHSGMTATIIVTGSVSGANLNLSQTNLNLTAGQSSTVYISGNGGYYLSSSPMSSVATGLISGSSLTVTAHQTGNATITVCQNSPYSCKNLNVTVTGSVLGANIYPNGQLISEYGTVYIVYKNTKTAFANAQAFLGLGFSFSNVLQTGFTSLSNSGFIVRNPNAQHPWGSWIKSGNTVYFVHESGLIPVPDLNTLYNNGGQLSMIVPANVYDFYLPTLSPMAYSDYRLK